MFSKIFKGITQNIYVYYTEISEFNISLPCHALPYLAFHVSPSTDAVFFSLVDEMKTLVQADHEILL